VAATVVHLNVITHRGRHDLGWDNSSEFKLCSLERTGAEEQPRSQPGRSLYVCTTNLTVEMCLDVRLGSQDIGLLRRTLVCRAIQAEFRVELTAPRLRLVQSHDINGGCNRVEARGGHLVLLDYRALQTALQIAGGRWDREEDYMNSNNWSISFPTTRPRREWQVNKPDSWMHLPFRKGDISIQLLSGVLKCL
jgi:hypothetical protein